MQKAVILSDNRFIKSGVFIYIRKKLLISQELQITIGWGTWIRTKEITDSESAALPLGYTPIGCFLSSAH